MNKLVSIISPCYNGEKYIHRMLDSIKEQTYKHLEVILINDGSRDATEDIIFSYKDKFENQGYRLIYLKQENQGQSSAINQGLKVFSGDYVAFIDSDDFLSTDAIEKKVAYMENHPEKGMVINKIKVLDFESLTEIGNMARKQPVKQDELYKDLISGKNVFYTPGGYFIRSSMFREVMPKPLQILAPREIGQNFQLFLPLAYKYPVGYVDDYLYYYLVRKDSHSHIKHTFEKYKHNWDVCRETLYHIAEEMEFHVEKLKNIKKLIDIRYYRQQMLLCSDYKDKKGYRECFNKLITLESNGNKLKGAILRLKYYLSQFIQRVISKYVRYKK